MKGLDGDMYKKVAHVQIDSSDSESEGFVDMQSPMVSDKGFSTMKSGGSSTGGKDSTLPKSGGKGSLPQAIPLNSPLTEVELKLEMELPKNSKILMDCEAAIIFQGVQEHLISLSDDPKIKIPVSFHKAMQYCKNGEKYANSSFVRELLDSLKKYGVTDGEICMIGNVCPESVEEVYALVPSLKAHRIKNEPAIRDALKGLAKLKNAV